VAEDLKMVTLGDVFLEGFNCLILKFDNLPALQTDEVIMVFPFRNGLIAGFSISEFSFFCQAQPGKELHGPIDRRVTDLGIDFHHLGINLSQVLMPEGVQENVEDFLPLFRRF
jgi:hypothetical protein